MAAIIELDRERRKGYAPTYLSFSVMSEKDIRAGLSIYGKEASFVDRFETYGDGNFAFATSMATGERVRPILTGEVKIDTQEGTGMHVVSMQDVSGHFAPESGLPLINPGIRAVALARQTTDAMREPALSLARITSVNFDFPIGVGRELKAKVENHEKGNGIETFNATVRRRGTRTASLGLEYTRLARPYDPKNEIDPEYAAETAAQTAILALQKKLGLSLDDRLPLYGGIEEINILRHIKKGERVTVLVYFDDQAEPVNTDLSVMAFSGRALVVNQDGDIVQVIRGMRGKFEERAKMQSVLERVAG